MTSFGVDAQCSISVIGLGNVFLGDDGFGPLVIETFRCSYECGESVEVIDLGTPGLDLAPYLVTVVSTVWGFFIHSNVKWRMGWLEWFVSTPAFHHWHHTNDGPQFINKNYAPMLPWVDGIFGTYYLPKRWPEKYGIDDPIASGLTGQLLGPIERLWDGPQPVQARSEVPR